MIALCREHADKADNGAFTDDQLRDLKHSGVRRALEVRGNFDWMRQDLLAVVGGNFFLRPGIILQIGNVKCIWFDRDGDGYLLLNVRLPSLSSRPRARIDNNFWAVEPDVAEVVCPPNGRLLDIRYENGDLFRAEFFVVENAPEFTKRYPSGARWTGYFEFPITVVELYETAVGTPVEFGPAETTIGGLTSVGGLFDVDEDHVVYFVSATENDERLLIFDADEIDKASEREIAAMSETSGPPAAVRSVFKIDLIAQQSPDLLTLDLGDWSPEALADLVLRSDKLKELGPVGDDSAVMRGSPIAEVLLAAHREALKHDSEYQRLRRQRDRGANTRFHALYREQVAALAAAVPGAPVEVKDVPEIVAFLERILSSFATTAKPPL